MTSFANFSDQENLQIDGIIYQNIQPLAAVSSQLQKVVENIRSRPQWALLYNGDFRNQLGYNEHKVETVYAFGSSPRTNLTFNADYQHWSAKSFGPDRQGGDLALAFDYRITEDSSTPQPYVVSFSAQGEWLSRQKAVYKGQAKLTIPLGQKTGLSIPMSVTYASSADLIQESRVEGRFGFSFDVAKIAAAFAGRQ